MEEERNDEKDAIIRIGKSKKNISSVVLLFGKNEEEKNDTDLYALHRYAPVNSVIAVTNPMKKRTVYVKVIGRMPDTVYSDNIIVVVSSTAASMLGAKDAKFYVQVRYAK